MPRSAVRPPAIKFRSLTYIRGTVPSSMARMVTAAAPPPSFRLRVLRRPPRCYIAQGRPRRPELVIPTGAFPTYPYSQSTQDPISLSSSHFSIINLSHGLDSITSTRGFM